MSENSSNPAPSIAGDDLDMSVRQRALFDAKISKIYDYWLKKCDGDALPTRHAIDPVDVYDCLSMLMILEVVDGGRDFRIRLAGSEVEEAHDRTLKGVMVSDLGAGAEMKALLERLQAVVTSRQPDFHTASGPTPWTDGSLRPLTREFLRSEIACDRVS